MMNINILNSRQLGKTLTVQVMRENWNDFSTETMKEILAVYKSKGGICWPTLEEAISQKEQSTG